MLRLPRPEAQTHGRFSALWNPECRTTVSVLSGSEVLFLACIYIALVSVQRRTKGDATPGMNTDPTGSYVFLFLA